MRGVASWGRLSADPHHTIGLHDAAQVAGVLAGARVPGLAHGMGRSYGDVCLNPAGLLWLTAGLDRFISFDGTTGRLACEAGVLLRDIQRLALPRGWALPVMPGTQQVTVGGAIANDVHGKNHHRYGTFGDHVLRIRLVRTDGSTLDCGPDLRPKWWAATVGGLGLTGVITEAEIQLRRLTGPWLDTETIPFVGLQEFLGLADESEASWEHSVAWIDCLSGTRARGLFMRASPAGPQTRPEPVPRVLRVHCVPPILLVNRFSLRPFNALYFHRGRMRAGRAVMHQESFHYPLDALRGWNRLYGPAGFFQYQSVVPRRAGAAATEAMLGEIARSGEDSFLAVLKTFGERTPPGMLSFVQPGVTLSLDFPHRGARTLALFERLDAIVAEAGGRLYAAKDARMPRALFEAGYPRLDEFAAFRDPGVSSGLSRRLLRS